MDEFDEVNTFTLPPADSKIQNFYDKITELKVNWTPLEGRFYRTTQMGNVSLKETDRRF